MAKSETLILISLASITIILNGIFGFDSKGFLIELNGTLFEVFLIIWLFGIFEKRRLEKEIIEECLEEINRVRNWESREAGIIIQRNVKKLAKLKHTNINFNGCYMQYVELERVNLSGSSFIKCNLKNCRISRSDLSNVNLSDAYIDGTTVLSMSKTRGAYAKDSQKEDLAKAGVDISEIIFIKE